METTTVGIRITVAEKRMLEASAAVRGLTFSEYLRRQLKLQVKRKPGPVRKERKNG